MAKLRFEWRTRDDGDDTLLAIDVMDEKVIGFWKAEPAILTNFLNDMTGLDPRGRNGLDVSQRNPDNWGDLVIAREDEGDVLYIDPQLYWEGVGYWFRSRGTDPHTSRRRS